MKTARIIYNPTAGKEGFTDKLTDVLQRFEDAGYITSTHATTGPNNATYAARFACENNFDMIVASGGDGTVNEVINGMAEFDERPELGIIPMGTVNDFTRALKIPNDIDEAVSIILNGRTGKVDLGSMNGKYFMNIAGGGKITEVSYEAPSKLKAVIGSLAYYVKGIELIPQMRSINLRIEYDDELFEGEVMIFLLGLTNSIGGFEKLVPNAKLNDGYFSLLILEHVNLAEFGHILSLATRGEHLKHPKVHYYKAQDVKITAYDEVQLNLDGEFGGVLPAHFKNLKEFLQIRVSEAFYNEMNSEDKDYTLPDPAAE
ncbi:Diacylglycerol kinase [Jeotgalicoccus aerolatus]|uniref:Diacylglycerol kinase (ATP) n=1 Tax=Jeotgalicoccus aerolatus TaxID=709510 RepID=A0ABS4HPD2_9STAP|nr:diacylglycerol kinase [Jeotgalicoccus aerolatus]MBP1952781.1 diacylglycerol kinase (ATP) [Jeotgalicoccus aerolatus]NMA80400.1 diacylglycerol kinase [Jeotgalicoccus aerolatus]CAD2080780.1 Diacylglycerol kinase [Jeotgalicoccus aerolatus]GGE08216.1 diacylglycerol kinase [Jeotgalicoccus aerolatus]HJG33027.1 diacylglycerol kinase [Jeotgalicoccus aerolatus]